MVGTILLPLDGSPLAELALPYAVALARRSGASIVLIEAVEYDASPDWDPRLPEVATVARAHGSLGEVANRLRADGVTATAVISHEHPVAAILAGAQLHRADLIVMSTHGRSGLGRMVFGSVADQVIQQAEVPVLLVPSTADRSWPSDRALTVLVPLDGSAWGEAPLDALLTLPMIGPPGADLLLVRIVATLGHALWGKNVAHVAVDEARRLADGLSYLTDVSARLAERGYTPRVEVVAARSAEAIANVARDRGVDLIAMATRGRSGLARAMLGSVATATVQRADVPILLVRPAEARPHAPAVEPLSVEAGSVKMIVTGEERDLVAAGLQSLLADPGRDEDAAMPIRALLSRIVEAQSDAPKQPVVTTT